MKKERYADKCPLCGNLSFFFSVPTKEWLCDVKCDLCKGTIKKDVKGLIPYTYIYLKGLNGGVNSDR